MPSYPKPDGWQGGPDGGHFLRTGAAGHIGANPNIEAFQDLETRKNASPIGDFCISAPGIEADWDDD